jgi:serine/threonine protein phosphatase PrpC
VLAVADGAGSRRRSAQGASLAVGLAVDIAAAEFGAVGRPDGAEACRRLMTGVFDKLRAAFHRAVKAIPGAAPDNYATTLTVALIADPFIGLASVGDGFAVVRTGWGEAARFHVVDYELADSAEAGQTSSGSSFLTSSDVLERRRVYVIPNGDVTGILLATDGMENTLVDIDEYGALRTYPETLHDIMAYLGDAPDGTAGEIVNFLVSRDVAAHTRDDKTLLLAVRR